MTDGQIPAYIYGALYNNYSALLVFNQKIADDNGCIGFAKQENMPPLRGKKTLIT